MNAFNASPKNPHGFFNILSVQCNGGMGVTGYKPLSQAGELKSFVDAGGSAASVAKRTGKPVPVYKLVGYLEPAKAIDKLTKEHVGQTFTDKDGDAIKIIHVDESLRYNQQVIGQYGTALFFYDVKGNCYDSDGDREYGSELLLPKGDVKFVAVE